MKVCRRLMRQASSRETSIILETSLPSKTARKCFSPLSTRMSVFLRLRSSRMSSTYLQSSSKGTLPGASTSLGVSITSLRLGTSSSRMVCSNCFQWSSIWLLQQLSISSLQNFYSLSCFCTSFSKTPNCGERRSVEKMDYFFSKAMASRGLLMGFGLFLMRWVRLADCLDSESSPELFYSPSRISKDIQNYYSSRTNCQIQAQFA